MELLQGHSSTGVTIEESNLLGLTQAIDDIILKIQQNLPEEKSVIAEYLHKVKKKIWRDKVTTCDLDILATKLLQILDQGSTSKEKVLTPFWTPQSKERSQRLWLPTETGCVGSVLNSSKDSLPNAPMGSSWFSITKRLPLTKNSSATSFQLSQYSLPESMDCEATKSKKPRKKLMKTMKFRLFPNDEQKKYIDDSIVQFRWYYNAVVNVVNMKYKTLESLVEKKELKYNHVRDEMMKYSYSEDIVGEVCTKKFDRNEKLHAFPKPLWMEGGNVHNRIPRGACKKFTQNVNSAITNYINNNITKFKMNFMSRKKTQEFMLFEDANYPKCLNQIKSHYWYRTKAHKRVTVSFQDVFKESPSGFEIIHDKVTNKYFLHYPVDIDYFPEDSIRNENQVKYTTNGERVISLDPGIRKFLVGYNPAGEIIYIADNANKELIKLILEVDSLKERDDIILAWKRIGNLVDEMHNKTIAYLIENYDVILLPDFRTQDMLRSKTLHKKTKRLMAMYAFYRFKTKLKFKCDQYNKRLIIVDESYTTRTCTCCGNLNEKKSCEFIKCSKCGIELDRDVVGSRNIFIKNTVYAGTV
jgi:putative transposase